jgi:hypothetical protein
MPSISLTYETNLEINVCALYNIPADIAVMIKIILYLPTKPGDQPSCFSLIREEIPPATHADPSLKMTS